MDSIYTDRSGQILDGGLEMTDWRVVQRDMWESDTEGQLSTRPSPQLVGSFLRLSANRILICKPSFAVALGEMPFHFQFSMCP